MNKGEHRAFVPTSAQRRYFVALAEAILSGAGTSDRELAPRINVHHGSISQWRETPDFEDWVAGELRKIVTGLFPRLLLRSFAIGMKGSVKHMEFFARYSGEAPARDSEAELSDDERAKTYSVHLLVPRPPALEAHPSLTSLPPRR